MEKDNPALQRLVDQVVAAGEKKVPLDIRGGGTKAFYGETPRGEPLDMRELSGVSSYEPTELVVTARAGTPVAELDALLAERGQYLPFEPPHFGPGGTVGGMVASGLSGPARAAVGAVRDYVLGTTMLNGRGEVLTFGGQVMKNVAGFDVSRLLAGSLGVLGVICEVSLKVLPTAPAIATLVFELREAEALKMLHTLAGKPLPLSASAWHQGRLVLRLAGAQAAVHAACEKLGGTTLAPAAASAWWDSLRDHTHPFFAPGAASSSESLWRLSVPDTGRAPHAARRAIHRMGRGAALVAHVRFGTGGARRSSPRGRSRHGVSDRGQIGGRLHPAVRAAHAHPSKVESRLRPLRHLQPWAAVPEPVRNTDSEKF